MKNSYYEIIKKILLVLIIINIVIILCNLFQGSGYNFILFKNIEQGIILAAIFLFCRSFLYKK